MKKCLVILLAVLVVGLFLVGCGESKTANQEKAEEIATKFLQDLTMDNWDGIYNQLSPADTEQMAVAIVEGVKMCPGSC
jgi:hypothetical protein